MQLLFLFGFIRKTSIVNFTIALSEFHMNKCNVSNKAPYFLFSIENVNMQYIASVSFYWYYFIIYLLYLYYSSTNVGPQS